MKNFRREGGLKVAKRNATMTLKSLDEGFQHPDFFLYQLSANHEGKVAQRKLQTSSKEDSVITCQKAGPRDISTDEKSFMDCVDTALAGNAFQSRINARKKEPCRH